MLTSLSYDQKKRELVSALERFEIKNARNLDWSNRMLVIHTMHKALESVKNLPDEIQQIIIMTLAYCYEDRGFFHEAAYWYNKFIDGCGDPLQRLAAQGNLIINLINLGNMPGAGQVLSGITDEASCGAPYAELLEALRLYYEAVGTGGGCARKEEILQKLLALCRKHIDYFLMQKLELYALEACSDICLGNMDHEKAIRFQKQAAAMALETGNMQKAAGCRKAISKIYEDLGDLEQAWRQYRKYYRLSSKICRARNEEFSDYLSEINNLGETEQEISSLQEMRAYLCYMRNTDALTGVCSRRFWDETLEQKARESEPGAVFSILMLDVDSFKEYNDTLGHLEGDRALKSLGSLLKGCIRTNDDVLARFGGDEFAVLVEGMGEAGSKRLAERIQKCISGAKQVGSSDLTLSIGISTGGIGQAGNFTNLLEEADAALYYSKYNGRNRFTHMLDIKRDGLLYD